MSTPEIKIILKDDNTFLLIEEDKEEIYPIEMLINILLTQNINYINRPSSLGIAKTINNNKIKYDLYQTNINGSIIYSRKFLNIEELITEAKNKILLEKEQKKIIQPVNINPKRKKKFRLFKRK